MDIIRLEVANIARRAEGRGPDVCVSAAPGYTLGKPGGVSWCQIFWLWCLREAGLTDRVWPSAPEWPTLWLPRTPAPLPGDMAYLDQPYQHGAVVLAAPSDGYVDTADGNSGDAPGRVVLHRYPVSHWTRFYSIAPLLRSADVDPLLAPKAVQIALTAAGFPCGAIDGRPGPKTAAALLAWALAHPEAIR